MQDKTKPFGCTVLNDHRKPNFEQAWTVGIYHGQGISGFFKNINQLWIRERVCVWGIGVGVGEVTTRVITWEESGVFYYIEQTVQYIF